MALSKEVINKFAKITNDSEPNNKTVNTYGTIVRKSEDAQLYVQLDGSDVYTPITSTTAYKDGERVLVSLGDHKAIILGNLSSMAATENSVGGIVTDQIEDKVPDIVANEITANRAVIDTIVSENIEVTNLTAEVANIKDLKADKAEIGDLVAQNAEITNLKADLADIKELRADNALINSLKANTAEIERLHADIADIDSATIDEAEIGRLIAADATIGNLDAKVGKIDTLMFGNASGDVIQTGFAESIINTMGEAWIQDAMIGNLSANRITSGTLNANNIKIESSDDDGSLIFTDGTIQAKDKNDTVRVQIGKDANGDYSIVILDANGKVLFNEGGIGENTIRDLMIADDANISAGKLDLNSLFSTINSDDNTSTIKASKVYVDADNQTLDISFGQMTEDLNDTKGSIETQGTKITAIEGQLSTKVWQQDIDAAKGELDTKYSSITQDLDTIALQASKINSTVFGRSVENSNPNMLSGTRDYISNDGSIVLGNNNEGSPASILEEPYEALEDGVYDELKVLYRDRKESSKSGYLVYFKNIESHLGATYYLSYYVKGSNANSAQNGKYQVYISGTNSVDVAEIVTSDDKTATNANNISGLDAPSKWERRWIRFTLKNTVTGSQKETNHKQVVFNVLAGSDLYICGVKLEIGEQATPWSPSLTDAPVDCLSDDIYEKLGNVYTKEAADAKFTITPEDITSVVSKTFVTKDSLSSTTESMNTLVSQTASDIRNEVSYTYTSKSDFNSAVKKIETKYRLSDSTTELTGSGEGYSWSTQAPAWTEGAYMWSRSDITYCDNRVVEGTPTCISGATGQPGLRGLQGPKGEDGINGADGKDGVNGADGKDGTDGKTSYFHIKYSSVPNPTSSQISETPNTYIGTYVDFTQSDSNDPSKYTWSKFEGSQGEKGEKGIPGTNGEDGRTQYLHIAYAKNSLGSFGFSTTDSSSREYIGTCVDFVQDDPTDYTRYTWTKIKGDQGMAGEDGVGIRSVASEYYKSTSKISQNGDPTGWTTDYKEWEPGYYIWSRTVITYDDSTDSKPHIYTTTPICNIHEEIERYNIIPFTKDLVDPTTKVITLGNNNESPVAELLSERYNGFKVAHRNRPSGARSGYVIFFKNIEPQLGATYYLSYYVKGTNKYQVFFSGGSNTVGISEMECSCKTGSYDISSSCVSNMVTPSNWERRWIRFKLNDTLTSSQSLENTKQIVFNAYAGTDLYICGVKLEIGDRATPWSPALADNNYFNMVTNTRIVESQNSILSEVSSNYATASSVNNLSSRIDQLPNEITSTVSANYTPLSKTISKVEVEYRISTSKDYLQGSYAWQTSLPTASSGQYIWTRTVVTYADSTSTSTHKDYTKEVCLTGAKGDKGDKGDDGSPGAKGDPGSSGRSIVETKYQYYLSTSKDSKSNGYWRDTPYSWVENKYQWKRLYIRYDKPLTDGTYIEYVGDSLDQEWHASSRITQLADALVHMVVNENGGTFLVQNGDSWTFNTGRLGDSDLYSDIDSLKTKSIYFDNQSDALKTKLASNSASVEELKKIGTSVQIGEYEYVDFNGNLQKDACINMGSTGSDFRYRITNTKSLYTNKDDVLVAINAEDRSLETSYLKAHDEAQIGHFAWVQRSNGNLGLSWRKGES